MGQRIRNQNRIKKSGTRLVSFLLAILLALLPAASGVGGPLTVFAESGTVRTLFYGNLLKEGSSFSFYGKDVPRNGMWAYQLNGTPVFCLEPTKRMFNGAAGRVDWYDIGTDELPYGITVEKAEALYYALTNGGNFEGGLCDVSKSQGGYMMMQAAVWAIMSDEWDIDKFQREMEDKIIPNAKDPSAGPRIRSYVDMFTKNATDQIRENVCPSFASKYPESAPSFQMKDNGDGTYQYSFTTDGSWMQNELVYEVPAGWEYRKSGNEVTFVCKNGNLASKDYFYDATMTPEAMMEKFQIRFNEEGHIIYAHNNDGDFQIFKYGLAPSLAKDCGNDKVAAYYHYGSISEYAGKRDGVYYDVYRDQEGNILDYGVVKDQVDTMTGVSTAIDRKFAPALVPWSVLDERYGEIINDAGDIGNREPGTGAYGRWQL